MKKIILAIFVLAAFIFNACSSDNDISSTSSLTLSISGLENLGTQYQYEGWIIVNGKPISTGTFTVDDSGNLSNTSFVVNTSQLAAATRFEVSVEPNPDTDALPASTKILSGDFEGNTAAINSDNSVVSSTSAIGSLADAEGKFILATPTDGSIDNELSGVWFVDNTTGTSIAGLSLPTLSEGWKYEGWVLFYNKPVSTGTFVKVDMADDNAASSSYKGTANNGPDFPGEDYLTGQAVGVTFPTDLRGAKVVISVEPNPDNSVKPFVLKPLELDISSDAVVHKSYDLEAGSVTVLSGTALR
ncbi:anti-sigma factor [Tenacibaculum sp. UWU-22]|uniref:anti-sigma factor n=1 Tax=Tenacibaculum sp. UWU-22 TaxID=3234187 RepID=UPI0034DAE515